MLLAVKKSPEAAALWREDVKPSNATIACVAVLWFIVALSLKRSFVSDRAYFHLIVMLPALAIGSAVAWKLGRRNLGTAFLILVGGAVLTLPLLFAREHAPLGLPTPEALSDAFKLVTKGALGTAQEVAPIQPSAAILSVLWLAGLVLGFLATSWVMVSRPLGAVMTGLMMIGYSGQVGAGDGRTMFSLAAVAATIAFFLAEGRLRISNWSGKHKPLPKKTGIVSLAIAGAVATLVGLLFADTKPILDLRTGDDARVVVLKPLSRVRELLDKQPPFEVMRVRASLATYWRLTALSDFDDNEFTLTTKTRPLPIGGSVPTPDPLPAGPTFDQSVTLTTLVTQWVPGAFAIVRASSQDRLETDSATSTVLLTDAPDTRGRTYEITSKIPDRNAVIASAKGGSHRPNDTDKEFSNLAASIATSSDPIGKALQIEAWFRKEFTYDLEVEPGHSRARLLKFINARRGYCEQFAVSMVEMLRGFGIQARVGVGFLPGGLDSKDGRFVVSTKDAHAWVEANLPLRGWTIFDPTPGRGDAASADGELSRVLATPTPRPTSGSAAPTPTPDLANPSNAPIPADIGSNNFLKFGSVLAMLALVFGAAPLAKARRRKRRHAQAGNAKVLGAWDELLDRLVELGIKSQHSQTATELCVGIGADTALGDLVSQATFSTVSCTNQDAANAWTSLELTERKLYEPLPGYKRLRVRLDPRPLIPRRRIRPELAPTKPASTG